MNLVEFCRAGLLILLIGLAGAVSSDVRAEAQTDPTLVQIGQLVYADGRTGKCFSMGFLDVLARHTNIRVARDARSVTLGKDELSVFPFVIMTGEGKFELTDEEVNALQSYLRRGGFVLASAGCSNDSWARSFNKQMKRVLPKGRFTPLKMEHGLFHTVFDVTSLRAKKGKAKQKLLGLELDGRLAVVFSPLGLNDTDNAGVGCCCCGGNELRDAHLLNANILAYALTH